MTLSQPPQDSPLTGHTSDAAPLQGLSVSSPLASYTTKSRQSSALSLLLGFALVVAVGGVAFATGRLTAPAATAATDGGTGTRFGGINGLAPGASGALGGGVFAGGAGIGGTGGLTVQGTVTSVSPTALSLTLANGTTVEIPLDAATTYHGQTAATASDVTTGATVLVEVTGGVGGAGARQGGAGGQGGPAASGAAPGASGAPGAGGAGFAGRGALGPAKDVTIVTP